MVGVDGEQSARLGGARQQVLGALAALARTVSELGASMVHELELATLDRANIWQPHCLSRSHTLQPESHNL